MFFITSSPAVAYHAVLVINALVSALIVPLGYVACLRMGLSRRLSFGVAMVTGLLPAGASALLAGYAFACHARGLIVVACYVLLGIWVFARRLVPRITLGLSALALLISCAVAWMLNRHLAAIMYTRGARSLSGQALARLHSVHGVLLIVEMAGGQLWRLILDSWGVAGVGLVAACFAVVRPGTVSRPLRPMAGLTILVTAGIAISTPQRCPSTSSRPGHRGVTWTARSWCSRWPGR